MGERAVVLARTWIGTPYRHQASHCGAGADCLGLVRGVWLELYGEEPLDLPPYTADWSETRDEEVVWKAASAHLMERSGDEIERGDVLLFRMTDEGVAKHLGIVGEVGRAPTFIHAYSGHGVVETYLSRPWRRRIAARFAFPQGDQ